jgi:poly(3-hydroxybutyrate) depolymerase
MTHQMLPAGQDLLSLMRLFVRGRPTWRGRPVWPEAIRRTAIMMVRARRAISAASSDHGGTRSRPQPAGGHATPTLATGTGLYGVFSDRRFARAVHPRAREMIQAHEGQDA